MQYLCQLIAAMLCLNLPLSRKKTRQKAGFPKRRDLPPADKAQLLQQCKHALGLLVGLRQHGGRRLLDDLRARQLR
jgi:hypothetical protein